MEQIINRFNIINEILVKNTKEQNINEMGLLNGKLGLCLYFYSLARETGDHVLQELANQLMGEMYESVRGAALPPDFYSGLAGIAWGISYLVKNDFVDADLDEALSEVDDRLYRYLEENLDKLPANLKEGILGYLAYSLSRYEDALASGNKLNRYIFKRLSAKLINHLGQMIEEEKFLGREPLLFSIFWDLPLILILLAKSRSLEIDPSKVDRIIEHLDPKVTSLIPRLHGNRLYLLLGMESVLVEMELKTWREHVSFLWKNIDQDRIIDQECANLNITIVDGISGLAWIGKKLVELTSDPSHSFPVEKIVGKITGSVAWGDLPYHNGFKKSISLISGLSGVGMLFLEYMKEVQKAKVK